MRPRTEFDTKGFLRGVAISLGSAFVMSLFMRGFGTSILAGTLSFGLLMPLGALGVHSLLPSLRTRSFVLTVFLQVVAISVIMGASFLLSLHLTISSRPDIGLFDPRLFQDYRRVFLQQTESGVRPTPALWGIFGAIALTFLIAAIAQISTKLGKGVLWNWITGKYHEPREEERIVMFLDLKDSTTLAEQLGNLRFSALVRDFFQALSRPAARTSAEVSHYIGDEAVITWRPRQGLRRANCLQFLKLFDEELERAAPHFDSLYGTVPKFKAGLHIGPVVATEVGEIKSEIVFHGDVMNTAARIQGLCNDEGVVALVSSDLADRLGDALAGFRTRPLGLRTLKGRVGPVEILELDWRDPRS